MSYVFVTVKNEGIEIINFGFVVEYTAYISHIASVLLAKVLFRKIVLFQKISFVSF